MHLAEFCKLFPGFLSPLDLAEIQIESKPTLSFAGVELALEVYVNCVKRSVGRAIQDTGQVKSRIGK